jgi:hypothetical protein
MLEWESIRSIEIEFSIRSSRQKQTVWAWAWRFAAASSKHLAVGYGRLRTLILERLFVSPCRLQQPRGYERALGQVNARRLVSTSPVSEVKRLIKSLLYSGCASLSIRHQPAHSYQWCLVISLRWRHPEPVRAPVSSYAPLVIQVNEGVWLSPNVEMRPLRNV